MKRHAPLMLCLTLAACGGGDADETADEAREAAPAPTASTTRAAPAGAMTSPDWFVLDEAANTVHMTLTAGETSRANYWNFNGHINGEIAINVPVGSTVTIELVNRDPNMKHSVGVSPMVSNFMVPPTPTPAFEGAITANPTSMVESGMPGETQTITFTASEAGNYTLLCYVPGHTGVGMWLFFNVTADGQAGVQGL